MVTEKYAVEIKFEIVMGLIMNLVLSML